MELNVLAQISTFSYYYLIFSHMLIQVSYASFTNHIKHSYIMRFFSFCQLLIQRLFDHKIEYLHKKACHQTSIKLFVSVKDHTPDTFFLIYF